MNSKKARFIAGATCPACGVQDVIKAVPHCTWWCTQCGYSEPAATDQTTTQTNDESAPIKWKNS